MRRRQADAAEDEDETIHGQHAMFDPTVADRGPQRRSRRTGRHQHGPEVFGGGMHARRMRRLSERLAQTATVALHHRLAYPGGELGDIRGVVARTRSEVQKVMGQAS